MEDKIYTTVINTDYFKALDELKKLNGIKFKYYELIQFKSI